MDKKAEGRKMLQEFEAMREKAELRALSKTSLERPLDDNEFRRMKELAARVCGCKLEYVVQTLEGGADD